MKLPEILSLHKWKIAGAVCLLIFLFSVWTGMLGLDFGKHWDESRYVEKIWMAGQRHSPFPAWYNYPSLSYYLALPAIKTGNAELFRQSEIRSDEYDHLILRGRIVFLCICSLLLFMVFLTAKEWGLHPLSALLAAGTCAFSFEWSYHSRWMAPDALMALMAVLCGYWLSRYSRQGRSLFLYLAALFAGLCAGSKYPGAILLLPVLLVGLKKQSHTETLLQRILRMQSLAGLCLLGFLLSTPGALFEFDLFREHIAFESAHYQEGHPGHTVAAGWGHFSAMLQYFSFSLFSPVAIFSIILFAGCLAGLLSLRVHKKIPSWAWVFTLIYIAFFSMQKVMIVRNYLVLLPFFALFAACGWEYLFRLLSTLNAGNKVLNILPRAGAGMLLAGILCSNALYDYKASRSIQTRNNTEQAHLDMLNFIRSHPEEKVLVTKMLLDYWRSDATRNIPSNILDRPDANTHDDSWVAVATEEHPFIWRKIEANHPDLVVRDFGPRSVNFSAYPSFPGPRLLILRWKYVKGVDWKFQEGRK